MPKEIIIQCFGCYAIKKSGKYEPYDKQIEPDTNQDLQSGLCLDCYIDRLGLLEELSDDLNIEDKERIFNMLKSKYHR